MLERPNNSMVAQVIKADRGANGGGRMSCLLLKSFRLACDESRFWRAVHTAVAIVLNCSPGSTSSGGGPARSRAQVAPSLQYRHLQSFPRRRGLYDLPQRHARVEREASHREQRPSSAMGSTSVRARSSSGASPLGAVRGSAPEPWPRGTSRRARWSSVGTGSLEARMIPIIGICLTSVECINTFRPLGGFHRDARTSAPMGTILL